MLPKTLLLQRGGFMSMMMKPTVVSKTCTAKRGFGTLMSRSFQIGRSKLNFGGASSQLSLYHVQHQHNNHLNNQQRWYSPMTKEEEETEKQRVAQLSDFKKEQELRQLNREIMKLNMLKGINTGELYSIRGRYKLLLAEYGLPMMVWYGAMWMTTGAMVFVLAEVGGMDAMAILAKIDVYTGLNMVSRVDPTLGKMGIILILNELLEPIRLPFVVLTVKPVIDRLYPPKV